MDFWAAAKQTSLADVRRGIRMVLGCFPAKMKAAVFVDAPRWLKRLVLIVRMTLLPKKLAARISFVRRGSEDPEGVLGLLERQPSLRQWQLWCDAREAEELVEVARDERGEEPKP
jgi:hypothetical protein